MKEYIASMNRCVVSVAIVCRVPLSVTRRDVTEAAINVPPTD